MGNTLISQQQVQKLTDENSRNHMYSKMLRKRTHVNIEEDIEVLTIFFVSCTTRKTELDRFGTDFFALTF